LLLAIGIGIWLSEDQQSNKAIGISDFGVELSET
jgi:hypothetical protein